MYRSINGRDRSACCAVSQESRKRPIHVSRFGENLAELVAIESGIGTHEIMAMHSAWFCFGRLGEGLPSHSIDARQVRKWP